MLKFHDPLLDEEGTRKKTAVITKAIITRSVISLSYNNGESQCVEPFVLGFHNESGKYLLRCFKSLPFEINEKEENWLLLEVDKIQSLHVTNTPAKLHRKQHFSLTDGMDEIIMEVTDFKRAI